MDAEEQFALLEKGILLKGDLMRCDDTGWLKIGNDYYFMRGDGSMGTGWRQMEGSWYYFQSNGKCMVNS